MERRLRITLDGGTFGNVSAIRSRTMAAIRDRNNRTTEIAFRMALVRNTIRGWKLHCRDLPGKPDFYFARARIAVFIDGDFWHGNPAIVRSTPTTNASYWRKKIEINRARDLRVTRLLRRSGIRVIRIWESELKDEQRFKRLVLRIRRRIRAR